MTIFYRESNKGTFYIEAEANASEVEGRYKSSLQLVFITFGPRVTLL
jgi:hypothetical protein